MQQVYVYIYIYMCVCDDTNTYLFVQEDGRLLL